MDLRKIKKLIELVEESGIAELEVKSGEEAVRITMATAGGAPIIARAAAGPSGETGDSAVGGSGNTAGSPQVVHKQVDPKQVGQPLKSPLSGTFYTAPSPDAEDFVAVGGTVSQGDVLCIVESMKMMNRIEADRAGVVTAVLVANGEPVESGQPLFLIDG